MTRKRQSELLGTFKQRQSSISFFKKANQLAFLEYIVVGFFAN